jgi:TonB family protein
MLQKESFRYAVSCLALTLLAGGAHAQLKEHGAESRPGIVGAWISRLDSAEERIRTGDYRKAYKMADALEEDMIDMIESGPGAGALLARTLVARSLAGAGLGQIREATWDWFMARSLHPELTEEYLSPFGPPAQALTEALTKVPRRPEPKIPPGETVTVRNSDETGVSRPQRLGGDSPKYPYALRAACIPGVVIVEGIVGEDGLVHRPSILKSPNPLLALATMEGLRTWRFKPAQYEGKPVPVYYTLTINYSVQQCHEAQRWGG